MILDRVVCPPGQNTGDSGPLVTVNGMGLNDDGVLCGAEWAVLHLGTELVAPAEPAGLAGSTGYAGADQRPVSGAMLLNKLDERSILLGAPRTLDTITAGGESHRAKEISRNMIRMSE